MVQFRSETMVYGTLVIPADRAHEFIDILGRKTNIHVVDMNAATSVRQYKKYIQRIDEMERILRFLFEEIHKLPGATIQKNQIESFLEYDNAYQLDRVEESLQKLYQQFVRFRENNDNLQQQKQAAVEEKAVAMAATRSLQPDFSPAMPTPSDGARQGLLDRDVEKQDADMVGFGTIAGVITQADQEKFARTIHRATRGNAFTHFENIQDMVVDTNTGKGVTVMQNVFVIYFQGTLESAMAERIMRICTAFSVRNYAWPKSYRDAEKRINELIELIAERSSALSAYEEYFIREIAVLLDLVRPNANSLVEEWRLFCIKEKAIYATLNLFEGSDVTLRADCWYPVTEDAGIRDVLMENSNTQQVSAFLLTDNRPLPKGISPPTYFRTTEYTQGFQDFVDVYGVPRYKEANPALTTVVTLPFLFGIMYGDIGHGSIVFCGALYMCIMWHRQLKFSKDSMIQLIGGGRFMILTMSMFSTYCGFLYNDFFGIGLDIFGTRYIKDTTNPDKMMRNPAVSQYPFGFDPVWKSGTENELEFFNSFKMKFSIIVAFFHMGAGLCHKGANAVYHSDMLIFICEFIPQMIFFFCLVGYMAFLILYKWATDLTHPKPQIINSLINMFFFKVEDPFWPFQKTLQTVLLITMMICIPWMFLPKPLILRWRHGKEAKSRNRGSSKLDPDTSAHHMSVGGTGVGGDSWNEGSDVVAAHEEEEFSFSEEMIMQLLETIEFLLGVISNTASYLRLWALHLAHSQLSTVFFENIMLTVLKINVNVVLHGVMLFLAFGAFAAVTFGVMICMDLLECYLHALRLQWVEFQNKFYKADGYSFVGFSFVHELTALEED